MQLRRGSRGNGTSACVSMGSLRLSGPKLDQGRAPVTPIVVMIIMLAMPNGDSGVHVKPFPTAETCIEAANIEATDPFVKSVECAELQDGLLTLRFDRGVQPEQPVTTGALQD